MSEDCDVFIVRCEPSVCDGSHVRILLGKGPGEPVIAYHVTSPEGAREIAAMLCQVAGEIEAGPGGTRARLN